MDKTATGIGWAGMLPFIGLLVAGITKPSEADMTLGYFLVYSAVILSFLGGIHWGWAMQQSDDKAARQLAFCLLPPLAAWLALTFTSPLISLVILTLSFLAWLLYDRATISALWYRALRWKLTAGVVACHLVWILILVLR